MKPEVEAKVSEALSQLWIPIMSSVGIDEIHIDDNEDRRRVLDEYPRIDDEQWGNLVDTVKRKLGDVASVSYENRSLSICLPTVKLFGKCINIEINRESTENLSPINEFEFNEFEDMTKEGAIEYIEELYEIQESLPFDFLYSKTYAGTWFYLILDYNKFINEIESIREMLLKTPDIYKAAIDEASIELQKKADEQRTIQERINSRKEAEARDLAELENMVRPKLAEAEWHRPFRVSMNFGFYVLSLNLPVDVECRFESPNKADIVARVGELVNFANTYLSLKVDNRSVFLTGNQVRVADWKRL